ncbi:sulfatase-like hydrolase/transferase [Haloferula rosea]|uniref:sulfatase-like hydrolase/transferase n=1 Tax=Haloferula rosea TaxID=490093 RepID=UPI0019063B07|nr:sulfatase-like hydrolase/transferase [Haloferula rosea]
MKKFPSVIPGFILALCLCSSVFAATSRPNVILILADDLGYEAIGVNGAEQVQTPNLDRLAGEGVRFTNCFANPICTPSRVKIMTGQYNVRNYTKFGELDRGQTTFARLAQEAGYATCIAGKWQLGVEKDSPQHFGFEESLLWNHTRRNQKKVKGKRVDTRFVNPQLELNGEPVDYGNGEYAPQLCADFVSEFIEANKDQPFLVYYPMILTHCPFDPTPDSSDWDPTRPGSTTYKGDQNRPQKHFKDMASYMDKIVGQLEARLVDLGIRDNTLILFTGDNGTDTPIVTRWEGKAIAGDKGNMTDAGTRVPLIASWPGKIKSGLVTDELVDFADFLPTLCEVMQIPLPEDYPGDGVSLWPALNGGERHKPYAYVWFSGHGKFPANVYARTKEYRYLCNLDLSNPVFADVSKPYAPITLDPTRLNSEQENIMSELRQKVGDMAKVPTIRKPNKRAK